MRKSIQFPTLTLILFLLFSGTALATDGKEQEDENPCRPDFLENGNGDQAEALDPDERHLFLDRLITGLLERHHFNARSFDTELADAVFDQYLESLDPGRYYFLRSDVENLRERHADLVKKADDAGTGERINLAFDVFERLKDRIDERLDFAQSFLEDRPDMTTDGSLTIDRSEERWAESGDSLDGLWEDRIINDAIGLMLADREWEDAREILLRRYRNLRNNITRTTADQVFETFMNAHTHELDPHSAYFSPRNTEEFEIRMSLSLEGIGAALQSQDEYITITDILPGGPADQDGTLRPQDRITGVAPRADCPMIDVVGWRVDDAVQLIRGPQDSRIRLRYLPSDAVPGEPEQTIELVRDEVQLDQQAANSEVREVETAEGRFRVGIIRIPAFYMDFEARRQGEEDYRSTTRDVRALLDELKQEEVDAVLVDLRNNGGGSLVEATELAGVFLDGGPVVQLLDSTGELEVADTPENSAEWDGPLGVMVNRFSASASEIFAGAMQDYGRGLIIGSTTYGKGTIQNLLDLDRWFSQEQEVGQLKFTIGKFYRVDGDSMQHRGVTPDVSLPSAVSLEDFGESTKPNALPWDEIEPVDYDGGQLPQALVERLGSLHQSRVSDDTAFQSLIEDIEHFRDVQERQNLSLNIDERREEQQRNEDQRLARENVRRAARGEAPLDSLEDTTEDEDSTDVLLMESAHIMADYAAILPEHIEDDSRFVARRYP